MFLHAPEDLPCGQHDKFKTERQAMGSLVTERPDILAALISSISN